MTLPSFFGIHDLIVFHITLVSFEFCDNTFTFLDEIPFSLAFYMKLSIWKFFSQTMARQQDICLRS